MTILFYLSVAGVGVVWAFGRSPLGQAIGVHVDQFAEASGREPGSLN